MIKFVTNKIPDGLFRVGLAHGNSQVIAKRARIYFEELGAEKVVTTEIGPALGVYAGPDSLVIGIQSLGDKFLG